MFADFDALIFDCDGVLVNSPELAQAVELSYFSDIGLVQGHRDFVCRYEGRSTGEFRDAVRQDYRRIHGHEIQESFFDDMFAAVVAAYNESLSPIDGAAELVGLWSKAKAVASGSTPELVRLKLEKTGLAPHLQQNVYTSQGLRPKPNPDVFLVAAESMGVEPSSCIVIEDSAIGIAAAKSAGMVAIGFVGGGHCLPGHDQALRACGADWVFASHMDIAAHLFPA